MKSILFLTDNPTIDVKGVFLDMSNAFDKVWHEGLFFKLESYGIGSQLLDLVKDNLLERVRCSARLTSLPSFVFDIYK